jgi:anion-transporting  ArsA/GET3 family ATPase
VSALLDKRLVIVTGKGGTGKSTVAAALGLAALRQGKRALIVEVAEQVRLAGMFGRRPAPGAEITLERGLHGLSIDPRRAAEEWLRHQLRSGTLASVLGHSRVFQLLTAAAPGVSELVTMGKIWDSAQLERRTGGAVFDVVILDAPASGHGLALLGAPASYARIARVGPVARQAERIDAFTHDRSETAVVAVALPEEIPVTETIELEGWLEGEGFALELVIVNSLYPERLDADETKRLEGARDVHPAVAVALGEHRRAAAQREQAERLAQGLNAPLASLPFLFEPKLGRPQLGELSELLEEELA